MAWMTPTVMGQFPGESTKDFWDRSRKQHNEFAEEFNKDWLNRLFRHKIPLMPSFEEIMRKYHDANR